MSSSRISARICSRSDTVLFARTLVFAIPGDVALGKYLHCSMTSGANDLNDPKIFFDFSGRDAFASEFGSITWLRPNAKNEITVRFSQSIYHIQPRLKNSLELYLNFSGIFAARKHFYLREELRRTMPDDVTSLALANVEARSDRDDIDAGFR